MKYILNSLYKCSLTDSDSAAEVQSYSSKSKDTVIKYYFSESESLPYEKYSSKNIWY